jgi:curved DNA-binding protein CbpA
VRDNLRQKNPMRNAFLYEILEVSPTARAAVIKAAYRCLVLQYHPDRNPGDPGAGARMSLINRAYAVLSDPFKRSQYDQKMGIGRIERRGCGRASNPAKAHAGGGENLRPFAFRPLD